MKELYEKKKTYSGVFAVQIRIWNKDIATTKEKQEKLKEKKC